MILSVCMDELVFINKKERNYNWGSELFKIENKSLVLQTKLPKDVYTNYVYENFTFWEKKSK